MLPQHLLAADSEADGLHLALFCAAISEEGQLRDKAPLSRGFYAPLHNFLFPFTFKITFGIHFSFHPALPPPFSLR